MANPLPIPDPVVDPSVPKRPPGMAELPYEDDEPMESDKHRQQMNLLIETLQHHVRARPDVFIAGNMGVYYSVLQATKNEFRAPDFFVVLGAEPREGGRLSWVIWEEERAPDVVIELLSASTAANDRGRKKTIYARAMKVEEYFLFDPHALTLEGFTLDREAADYCSVTAGSDGGFDSRVLGLRLVVARGTFQGVHTDWLRWALPDGSLLPTGVEMAESERARAESERARAESERARADAERARAEGFAARLRAAGIEPGE